METFKSKLGQLGFKSYDAYLRSALWKSIRERAFVQHGCLCVKCRRSLATVIHHTEYSLVTLKGLCTDTLQPLCAPCHDDIHGRGHDGIDKFRPAKAPKIREAGAPALRPLPSVKRPKKKKPKKQPQPEPVKKPLSRPERIVKYGLNVRAFKLTWEERNEYNALMGRRPLPPRPPKNPDNFCVTCNRQRKRKQMRSTPNGVRVCAECLVRLWQKIESEITQAK
jgi:hypothetical protein